MEYGNTKICNNINAIIMWLKTGHKIISILFECV